MWNFFGYDREDEIMYEKTEDRLREDFKYKSYLVWYGNDSQEIQQ